MTTDDDLMQQWRQDVAESARIMQASMKELREMYAHQGPTARPLASNGTAANSWNTLKTMMTLGAVVVVVLSVGRWWGVTDKSIEAMGRIEQRLDRLFNDTLPELTHRLEDAGYRLKALEEQEERRRDNEQQQPRRRSP
jgi:hypothetical protein